MVPHCGSGVPLFGSEGLLEGDHAEEFVARDAAHQGFGGSRSREDDPKTSFSSEPEPRRAHLSVNGVGVGDGGDPAPHRRGVQGGAGAQGPGQWKVVALTPESADLPRPCADEGVTVFGDDTTEGARKNG